MKKNTHKTKPHTDMDAVANATRLVGAPDTDRVLTPEEERVLKAAEAELARLDRNTTAQTFERGALFAKAKVILLPKAFGKWIRSHTSLTVRHAWNHLAVDEKLGWHRKRCEAASVPPTTLFILATADDERVVNDVLCAFERGERMTGARVKAMIAHSRNEPVREVEPFNVGGPKGMIRLGEMRLRTEVDRFHELVKGALHHVEAAAEKIANGKTVTKSGLSDAIKIDCRHAHDVLSMTIAPIVSNSFDENANWKPGSMASDTAWTAVKSILFLLGGEGWPDRAEFSRWLTGTVLPVLRFAVHGEELPGFEAERIVHVKPDEQLASASDESALDETASDLVSDTDLEPPLADDRVVAIETERRKRRKK